ncbi:methyl-accepting chemotaxis protein [Treponema phagedenis]|uniref:methyl-accepting chemotaxis protein n=1 Tax=Treponema phagedenis TaxID=162 RepID=UPI0019820B74|nr:methyl-accepting chemotaxis protein [Treponema phagedenis]QSH95566.1 hypothetical protein C5O78_11190 [Treponema phagedenis]
MTIQKKIILTTTIVCFLCATVIGANILIISTRNLEKNINASNALSANNLTLQIDSRFSEILTQIDLIIKLMVEFDLYTYEDLTSYLVYLRKEYPENDFCLAFENELFANARAWKAPADFIATNRPWYTGAEKADGFFITEPYASVSDDGTYVAMGIAKKFKMKNGMNGVFNDDILLDAFFAILDDFQLEMNGYVFLIDDAGNLLSHPNEKYHAKIDSQTGKLITTNIKELEDGNKITDILKSASKDRLSNVLVTDYDGVKRFLYFSHSKTTDWTIGIAVSYNEIFAPIRRMLFYCIIILLIFLIIGTIVAFFAAARISRALKKTALLLHNISEQDGYLTVSITPETKDEAADVALAFNKTIAKIRNAMLSIRDNSDGIRTAIENLAEQMNESSVSINQITLTVENVKHQTTAQATSVEETTAASEEIVRTMQGLNDNIEAQSKNIAETRLAVEKMVANVESTTASLQENMKNIVSLQTASEAAKDSTVKVSELMKTINESSAVLLEASTIIQNVADQTNLLSMNAAIEAAHAGDSGRGFAVVAGEIRKLAEESSTQSKSISSVLKNLKTQIVDVSQIIKNSETIFNDIFSLSKKIWGQEDSAVQTMQEQGRENRQVLNSIADVAELTYQVRNNSDEVLTGSEQISNEMQGLSKMTEALRTAMEEVATATKSINSSLQQINNITQQNKERVVTLNSEIEKFKV